MRNDGNISLRPQRDKLAKWRELFPPGTPVLVRQTVERRGRSYQTRVAGVVEAWDELPTGSWYAHGRKDRLWLERLRLRKVDGEETLLVLDDITSIAKLEPAQPQE